MEVLAAVGGALLSSSLEMLFHKLESSEFLKFARQEEVLAELMNWKTMLQKIDAVLEDAEEKQITKRSVKIWLGELRDLAYDVEDILDEFETEALRRKLEEEPQTSTSMVQKLIPTCCTVFSRRVVRFNLRMGSKIKDIATKLEEITRQKDVLDLREIVGRSNRASERLPTTSLVTKAEVYGREKDEEAIVKLLLSGEASNDKVAVIPIQGMGGLGKTTLAKLVYNNEEVTDSFDLKAWVCVFEVFDVIQITKTILGSVSGDARDLNLQDLNSLQEKLKEKLSGKKFLIVLDDVWNEDYLKWTELLLPLKAGAPGSRIIVTTRNRGVSSTMGTKETYVLTGLSYDDCLSLFAQHVLGERNFDAHLNLKDIGEQMVHKCKGLPLAAKALGGLLRGERERAKWENILRSKIWEEEQSGILPALRLSYHHLPSHLKRCFAYCAIFPKDYEFDKDELISLWMAEGFLQHPKGKKRMEEIGLEYFDDLESRSFFQQSSSNDSRFVMHDLLHDLAQSVFGEICFNYEDLQGNKPYTSPEKVRYSSFKQERFDISEKFNNFYGMRSLRTFLALRNHESDNPCHLSNKVLRNLLPKLKCLRVLSLSGYCIEELPDSIDGLKHLRYLNVSYTEIVCLPESVGALYNLQTLILSGCERLTKLPSSIGNLINLHNLDISGTDSLEEMPWGISKLTSLHNLTKFIVGKGDGLGIRELQKLPHLCGKLSISGLHNVVDIRAAKDANLKDKQGLDELELLWIDDFNDSQNERDEDEVQVLDSLQPHENLEKLLIALYGGTKFPSWIGGPSFTNMVELSLFGCRKSRSLPSLGQLPLLQFLYINGMDAVKSVGLEFHGDCSPPSKAFKSLEFLIFENMLEWEDWSSSNRAEEVSKEEFSSLRELVLNNCPKLVGILPSHLPSLIKLEIHKCPLLKNSTVSLPSVNEMHVEECNEMFLKSLVDLSSLTILEINKISGLSCLDQGFMRFLVALEVLKIRDCNELKSLWCNGTGTKKLDCLMGLEISGCPELVSLAVEEQDLHTLKISDCESLETLPDWVMHGNNSNQSLLEVLVIEKCPSLESFPRGKLPTTLRWLSIEDCENLKSLPEGIMHDDNDGNNTSHLEVLYIIGCSSLTYFPIGKFPATLQQLRILNCTELESFAERMLQNNTTLGLIMIGGFMYLKNLSLEYLTDLAGIHIEDCPALESFSERGLSISNLKLLSISNCTNLKSLPNQMHNLTSLLQLYIFNCPSIVSIPKGGLPPNLKELEIESCKNLKQPMMDWGLHTLTSLRELTLDNTCPLNIITFPDDECLMLPRALTLIQIRNLNYLESISRGIKNLTSLECLSINSCPQLRSLPKEGLPASLGRFVIKNCPLLKQRCLKDKGEYWPILADIPSVETIELTDSSSSSSYSEDDDTIISLVSTCI